MGGGSKRRFGAEARLPFGDSVELRGLGLYAVPSPCERLRFWFYVWHTIVDLLAAILMAALKLAGWSLFIERGDTGRGFFEFAHVNHGKFSHEVAGFRLHAYATNNWRFYSECAARRETDRQD
jgi:hypothetical protein